MHAGIAQMVHGQRIGDIGHAVQGVVEAAGYSVVHEYVGHAIGTAMHEKPEVAQLRHRGQGPEAPGGQRLRRRADGQHRVARDRPARRRVERRHRRRLAVGPPGAHHRHHRRRSRDPHPRDRPPCARPAGAELQATSWSGPSSPSWPPPASRWPGPSSPVLRSSVPSGAAAAARWVLLSVLLPVPGFRRPTPMAPRASGGWRASRPAEGRPPVTRNGLWAIIPGCAR